MPWYDILPVIVIPAVIACGFIYIVFFSKKNDGDDGLLLDEAGHQLRWDQKLRISVYFHPELPDTYRMHWEKAVSEIEQKTGRPLFTYPLIAVGETLSLFLDDERRKASRGAVFITTDGGDDPMHGVTRHYFDTRDGVIRSALVTLPLAQDIRYGYGITLHEAMHVLGFAHDNSPKSIMWPYVQERPGRITDSDARLLRTVYPAG